MLRTFVAQGTKVLTQQAFAACSTRAFADAVAAIDPKGDISQLNAFVTTPEGKKELSKLTQALNELKRKEASLSAPIGAINWDNYAELDDDILAFVKTLETEGSKAMEKIDPMASEAAAAIAAIDAKKKSAVGAAAKVGEAAAAEAKALQAKVADIDDQLSRLGTMTLDDYLEENPEVLKKVDDEISKGELF